MLPELTAINSQQITGQTTATVMSYSILGLVSNFIYLLIEDAPSMLGGVPVPTAWRVLGLRMEERPPAMEVSLEYIE
jgi:hypothetical protein